jgi:hypothetical protein
LAQDYLIIHEKKALLVSSSHAKQRELISLSFSMSLRGTSWLRV